MKKKPNKFIAAIFLLFLIVFLEAAPARADYWGASMMSAQYQITVNKMLDQIEKTMIANAKMMAIRLVQSRLMSLFSSGGNGGPKVIGDWRQFIYGTAMTYSTQATNDFFRGMQSGVPSPLISRVITPAQKAVTASTTPMKPDLQNYVREGRADMVFQKGWAQNPWAAWRQSFMPQNDMGSLYAQGLAVQQNAYNTQAEVKKAEGVAGAGYEGTKKTTSSGGSGGTSSEQITMPGSSAKDMVTKIQSMPIDMVSMAKSVPEIAASMITSMLTQMMNKGFAMANTQINKAMSGNTGGIQSMIQGGKK
jgi:hypothetical protein